MLLFIVHVRHNTYNAYMHAGSNFMLHVRSVHSRTLCGSLTTSPTKLYTGTISVHITRQCLHTDHVRTNYYTDYAIHCVLATRSTNGFSTWTDPSVHVPYVHVQHISYHTVNQGYGSCTNKKTQFCTFNIRTPLSVHVHDPWEYSSGSLLTQGPSIPVHGPWPSWTYHAEGGGCRLHVGSHSNPPPHNRKRTHIL